MVKQNPQDITTAMLLEHMQSMENRMTKSFDKRFDDLETKFDDGFDAINLRLDKLEKHVDWLRDNLIDMASKYEQRFQKLEDVVFA